MIFSLNWLNEFVKVTLSADDLGARLTMAGVEVESLRKSGIASGGVVTAMVVSIKKHPNADRLSLCEVEDGTQSYSVVCGATNMKSGDRAFLAMPGAELAQGIKIKKSKIRDVVSEGMLCSKAELGLAEESDGIMILPEDVPLGKAIGDIMGGPDCLMDVSITPNRPDLMSIRGLAREISALLGLRFEDKVISINEGNSLIERTVSIQVEDMGLCKRYMARVVEDVHIASSPLWMQTRLEAAGIRPVNNVVDITNYVMFETGQPLHAFDLDKIEGSALTVRQAKDKESIIAIDGKERLLEKDMLVIADNKGPQAIAGVMGGNRTEITNGAKRVLIEAACFAPSAVRNVSKRLGLITESSLRFSRGIDIEAVPLALDMSTGLIAHLTGGVAAKGAIDLYAERHGEDTVTLKTERLCSLTGVRYTEDEAKSILDRLFIKTTMDKGAITAEIPSFRSDIKEDVDLIEEIARLSGYDNIPATMPRATLCGGQKPASAALKQRTREMLADRGFFEVLNYSFVSRREFGLIGNGERKDILIQNPLSEEQAYMRDSLIPSLLGTLVLNLSRKTNDVRIFEIAPVYIKTDKGIHEEWICAGLMHGKRWGENWSAPKDVLDFYDVKGVVCELAWALGIGKEALVTERCALAHYHPARAATFAINR
ncbi:MAG: phenylalanine--tRNA ligase subunit beta, partial [Deltaproteobacteria bacterium]|nr:phenylalanine--tRNA ligase subunit beta [Deltaproteobacteria bacterium]